jgi:superfamily II DNA or RNA helicase
MELADHFTYYAENYKYHPKYKARLWDGKICLINRMSRLIYRGLAQRIKKFCDQRNYTFTFDNEFVYENVSEHEVNEFVKTLNLPFAPRDYQIDAVVKCLRSQRRTLLSPTSSGKSLIIYLITEWYRKKTLIIVPTVGLVNQMKSDFISYGFKGEMHTSLDGLSKDKNIPADVVITTWQSLENGKRGMPLDWYNQFDVVFGDEAHGCKATTLIKILSNMKQTKYRFGTTGTLDGNPLNEATIEGLFGPKYKTISTAELMQRGDISNLKIKCIVLKYPQNVCKDVQGKTYQEEIDFLVNYEARIEFIKNLTLSLKGNKLVFFRVIDHGKILHDRIKAETDSNLFYIDGSVSAETREQIRKAIEGESDSILLASLGTTSTGVSINKLHHMIAASPSKSKIKVLQSIGRMLRLHETKQEAVLYDIVDDLSIKSRQNFTYKHFLERVQIYSKENFDYKIYNVGL